MFCLTVWQIKQLLSKLSPNPLLSIKLTIELNPSKFLDTKLANTDGAYKFNFYRKYPKLPPPWTSKLQSAINKIQSMVVQKEYNQSLFKKNIIKPG